MPGYTHREVTGHIRPEDLYDTDQAMRQAGQGYESLTEGREAGVLNPVNDGRRDWYEGRELIAWIREKAKQKRRRKAS